MNKCACGCGRTPLKPTSKWVRGHHHRGTPTESQRPKWKTPHNKRNDPQLYKAGKAEADPTREYLVCGAPPVDAFDTRVCLERYFAAGMTEEDELNGIRLLAREEAA
jgi:hypothetical protein